MKTAVTFASLILAVVAVVLSVSAYLTGGGEVERLETTINELESRLATAEGRVVTAQKRSQEAVEAPRTLEKEIVSIREEIADLSSRHEVLDNRVSESQNKHDFQIRQLTQKVAKGMVTSEGEPLVHREQLEELIEEKMKGQQRLGKEPPLAAVAARLGLEEVEQKALEDILRRKKTEFMDLLKTPRTDGSCLLEEFADEIIDAMTSQDEEKARTVFMKFFQRLTTDKVPGTQTTYFVEIMRMQEETKKAFKATLSQGQFKAFEALGIENPMDIKIPHEPIGVYLQQRMQATGVTPPGPGKEEGR